MQLAEDFYRAVLRPLLGVDHSAALIGAGSEVLGYDTPRSRDHDWGPRAQIFLSEPDLEARGDELRERLRVQLPASFAGYSTHFQAAADSPSRVMARGEAGNIDSLVEVTGVEAFLDRAIGVRAVGELELPDWLAIPEPSLRELTAGHVFHDGLRTLGPAREALSSYPRDV